MGEKARRPITATFAHVPVDSAVQLLADMAGLRMVVVDNVLYVTSPENAKDLQAQVDARAAKRREAERAPLVGGAPADPLMKAQQDK